MSVEISRAARLAREAREYVLKREALLLEYPELADDDETLLDTLDGCTTINEQLAAIAREALEAEALADGLKAYQDALARRKGRLIERGAKLRRMALRYMSELDLKKIVAPDLTATRKALGPTVVIIDENMIPVEFVRIERTPNKTAIKAALVAGEDIDGATLSNGGETIAIRIS